MHVKNSNGDAPPAQPHEQAGAAPEPEGLKLLFAASQIEETDPEDKDAKAEANTISTEAQVPSISSITVVSNGTGDVAADLESGIGREIAEREAEAGAAEAAAYSSENENDSETENLAIAALENQEKSFPQILHEILATTECQSILHWLPDGFSFLIVDKQRFSDEILPEYFRGALLNSFIRKLNRWGFRRVKSRLKGEESSFAHKNFVRDKPWLCMKMRCKSKPTYHKVPSAKNRKKKTKQKSTATTEASDSKSLAASASVSIVIPTKAPPPFLAMNGTLKGAFVPTYSRVATSEHEPLPLQNRDLKFPAASAPVRFLSTADAAIIRENQHQHLAHHQQRIFHERQILIAQMHQRHQLQLELQRLNQMPALIGEQFTGSHVQRAMMAKYTRDMLRSSSSHYRGEKK